MNGLIGALAILSAVAILMCIVYKRDTGRYLLKDLFHDIFSPKKKE